MHANTIKTRGLHLGVRFAPAASMDKSQRQDFIAKASQGFDWSRHDYHDKVWRLSSPQTEGDPRSHLRLTIQPDAVNFEDVFPVGPFDVFCDSAKLAMKVVTDVFDPKLLLGSGAVIRLTAQVGGDDARVFLGNTCLGLDDRLTPLNRPVHAIGLKLLMPPVGKDPKDPPWQAEVKIESLVEDVRQIFIEVDAKWGIPTNWSVDEILRRVRVADAFARTEVLNFLSQFESDVGHN